VKKFKILEKIGKRGGNVKLAPPTIKMLLARGRIHVSKTNLQLFTIHW